MEDEVRSRERRGTKTDCAYCKLTATCVLICTYCSSWYVALSYTGRSFVVASTGCLARRVWGLCEGCRSVMIERCGRGKTEEEGLARWRAESISKHLERSERSRERYESRPVSTLATSGFRAKSRGRELKRWTSEAAPPLLLAQSLRMRHYLRIQPLGRGGRAIPHVNRRLAASH